MDNKYNLNFDEAIKRAEEYVDRLKENINEIHYNHYVLEDIQEIMVKSLLDKDYQNYFIYFLYFNIYIILKNNVLEHKNIEVLDNFINILYKDKEELIRTVSDYIDSYNLM